MYEPQKKKETKKKKGRAMLFLQKKIAEYA